MTSTSLVALEVAIIWTNDDWTYKQNFTEIRFMMQTFSFQEFTKWQLLFGIILLKYRLYFDEFLKICHGMG